MKTWKKLAQIPDLGPCTVKELTDLEATRARRRGHNVMPISTGFVCLYQDDALVGVCGSDVARCAAEGLPLPSNPTLG